MNAAWFMTFANKDFNFVNKIYTPSPLFKSFTSISEHVFVILSSKDKLQDLASSYQGQLDISVLWSHHSKSSMFFKLGGTNNSLAITTLCYQLLKILW